MKTRLQENFSYMNILVIVFAVLAYDRSVVGQSFDPCVNPRPLGSAGKRSILYDPGTCEGRLCDNYIQEGIWYTIDGETTGNRMPESCVPVWSCGTYIPIWMNGAHPTADNPGPVTVSVCAQQKVNDDCCSWRDQIRVKYCKNGALDEYYVYQLKIPPYCDMAYCGGSGIYCGSNSAWNDVATNCTTPRCPVLTGQVDLSDPYISDTKTVIGVNGNSFTARKFSVKCTFSYQRQTPGDDGARFDVIFEAGEKAVAKFKIASSSTVEHSVVMDESYLAGYLDSKLKCKVSAYWQSSYPYRCPTSSREIYYGIQTLDESGTPVTSIPVQEGERVRIYMKATFPVTTPGCFNLPAGAYCNPSHTFRISSQKVYLSNCTFQLSYENSRSVDIVLSPIPTLGTLSGSFTSPMSFTAENSPQTQSSIFKNYKSKNVYISITDDKQRPYCRSWSDPNIRTFPTPSYPSGFYNAILTVLGDLYLVRLEDRNLEIQVRQFACSTNVVCNCGVMAREGNNVVGIDMCSRSSPLLIRYLIDSVNPGGSIVSNYYSGWTIYLPSGIEISVTRTGSFININVVGFAIEKYTGICTYTGQNDAECERLYRVRPEDSLFQITSGKPPKCKQSPVIPACDCASGSSYSVPCYNPDQSNLMTTKYSCNPTKARRKREDTSPIYSGNYVNVDELNNTVLTGRLPDRNLTWPTPNKQITEEQATEACYKALREAKIYELCISKINTSFIINACKTDIKGTEDLTLTVIVPTMLEIFCLDALTGSIVTTNNSSIPINNQTLTDLDRFKDTVCPGECSRQGTCVKGVCQCYTDFKGKDCAIDKRQAPTIEKVWTSECDIREKACTKMFMVASGASSTDLVCKIKDDKGVTFDKTPSVVDKQVSCIIPQSTVNSKDLKVDSTTNHTFFVSISNDGKSFSDEQRFSIFDGLCITFSSTPEFSLKMNSCAICGRCYQADEKLQITKDEVTTCKPTICQTRWSRAKSKSCNDGYNTCSSLSRLVVSYGILSLAFVFYKAIAHIF